MIVVGGMGVMGIMGEWGKLRELSEPHCSHNSHYSHYSHYQIIKADAPELSVRRILFYQVIDSNRGLILTLKLTYIIPDSCNYP